MRTASDQWAPRPWGCPGLGVGISVQQGEQTSLVRPHTLRGVAVSPLLTSKCPESSSFPPACGPQVPEGRGRTLDAEACPVTAELLTPLALPVSVAGPQSASQGPCSTETRTSLPALPPTILSPLPTQPRRLCQLLSTQTGSVSPEPVGRWTIDTRTHCPLGGEAHKRHQFWLCLFSPLTRRLL